MTSATEPVGLEMTQVSQQIILKTYLMGGWIHTGVALAKHQPAERHIVI
jgi:hypothetical protein